MLRPPPPRLEPIESDDSGSGSYGGLADVLEPDFEDDVTSLRMTGAHSVPLSVRGGPPSMRVGPPSMRVGPPSMSMRGGPASARGGPSSVRGGPISERPRAPVQVQDFAFADTVFGLPEEPAPPSSPVYVNDDADQSGPSESMAPHSYPLSEPEGTQAGFFARSRDEMRELWAGTGEIVEGTRVRTLRRVFALWSCFQWSRADLTRAAMIGLAVFVTAAAIGATTMDFGEHSAASSEVRAARTLDQHTGKKLVLHAKR